MAKASKKTTKSTVRSNNRQANTTNVALVEHALLPFLKDHPRAKIDVKQPYPFSIRVRIVDAAFAGQSWLERETGIWQLLEELPDDVFTKLSMLLLLTPQEVKQSFANREFEDPLPLPPSLPIE